MFRFVFALSIFILMGCSSEAQNPKHAPDDTIIAYHSEGCACCEGYFKILEEKGYKLKKVKLTPAELALKKSELGIPLNKRSCHTMVMDGKFIEGHVPVEGIQKLRTIRNAVGVFSAHGFLSSMGKEETSYEILTD